MTKKITALDYFSLMSMQVHRNLRPESEPVAVTCRHWRSARRRLFGGRYQVADPGRARPVLH